MPRGLCAPTRQPRLWLSSLLIPPSRRPASPTRGRRGVFIALLLSAPRGDGRAVLRWSFGTAGGDAALSSDDAAGGSGHTDVEVVLPPPRMRWWPPA